MKYHNLILRVWMRKSFTVLIIRSFFHLSCTSLPTGELESLQPALKELVSTIILLHEDASQRSGFSQHTGTTPNGTIGRFFCSSLRSKTHCHTAQNRPCCHSKHHRRKRPNTQNPKSSMESDLPAHQPEALLHEPWNSCFNQISSRLNVEHFHLPKLHGELVLCDTANVDAE